MADIRDAFSSGRILERAVRDIRNLLLVDASENEALETNVLYLWDDKLGSVEHAVSYGKEYDYEEDEALQNGYGILLEGEPCL